jgi:hypothetical protein
MNVERKAAAAQRLMIISPCALFGTLTDCRRLSSKSAEKNLPAGALNGDARSRAVQIRP